jgi:hypothetical protein
MIRTLSLFTSVALAVTALAAEPDYVVHEWGTFSTFGGSDGKHLKFTPDDTDLPKFMHSQRLQVKGGPVDSYVSMETPVIYFYSKIDRLVSVNVEFLNGRMTDWYPAASRPPSEKLRWDNIKVLATERPKLVEERGTGRYFAARETDAATVITTDRGRTNEAEKFLFYRGVGDFEMPFTVKALGNGRFTVKSGMGDIPGRILVSVMDAKVTFKVLGKLMNQTVETVELPAEASTPDKLGEAMTKLLTEQGLYEKEAKAMVKTWKTDWFGQNGTRLLYLVNDVQTNYILPLTVEPKPEKLVRVLVGRHDVLTPEREREIDALVKKFNGESNQGAVDADKELSKLGRYRSAAQAASQKRMKETRTSRNGS